MLQPISTDTSDFPEMRRKGCVYVDKTAYLSNLLTGLDARFFLARPRSRCFASRERRSKKRGEKRNNISSMNTTLCYMYMIEDTATVRILIPKVDDAG